ncbi:hypothetical protein AAFC00_006341 [Neodothiora populina]|uniref:Late endosomal/lysosomal adaptor and MAPK and MTOR activator 1 n=1 Tax=Neodothiora populina TaxID=2781224 RepID=A0ABR3P4U2_9PEZI
MGVCASCLGLNRRSSQEPAETEGLLYEDSQPQYGAIGSGSVAPGPDPEELRREREALEQICAQTSNELIDVLHHDAAIPGSKMASDYSLLLNKHFPNRSGASSPTTTTDDEAAWLNNTQGAERELWDEVKGFSQGHLVLTLHTSSPGATPTLSAQ